MANPTVFYENHGLRLRSAEFEDISILKDSLRPEQIAEVWASGHQSPEQALVSSFMISKRNFTLERNGRPIAMAGVAPLESNPGQGCVWLLTSSEVDEIKLTFIKVSALVIHEFAKEFPVLFNWVDARYTQSIEWLRRLGAQIHEPSPWGAEGLPFSLFIFREVANV